MKLLKFTALCLGALLLAGCAQFVRNHALSQMREGHYEQAIAELQEGTQRYPDSVPLRSALLSTRAEALARWTTEAGHLRAAGRWDGAQAVLQRALKADPGNERILALLDDLAVQHRAQEQLDAAEKLSKEGKKQQALAIVEQVLRDVPHDARAASLRRQLMVQLRVDSAKELLHLSETRPITLDFRGAPLSTVLEAITRGSGVNFILDKDVRQDARVTVFLRSATVEDAIDLVAGAHQLAFRIVDAQTVLLYPNTPDKQKEHQEQVVRVFQLANADAKSTGQLLKSMLHVKEPFVDERRNSVAIRESPEVVAMAERLVALHDAGEPEVMLEVEVLEIKTTRLTELGVAVPNSLSLTPLAASGGALTVRALRNLNSDRIGVTVGDVTLNLRREVGDFNILANPRVRTKNREKAHIVIGDRLPVVTSTATATGLISENISYVDVGLKLDVEPTVSDDDDVTMKLGLEVSSVTGTVQTERSLAYQIGTRNANTVLRLHDGETQILGGLISNDDRTSATRIPGLGDLPIAGRLFSSQTDDVQRTELVLAITPRVLRSAPRLDIADSQLWVGTDALPRLREVSRELPHPTVVSDRSAAAARPAASGASAPATLIAASNVPVPNEAATQPQGDASLEWTPPPVVKAGDVFTVGLTLDTSTPLRGAMVEVAFPAHDVEWVDAVEGPFFKQDSGTTSFTQSARAAEGRVSIGVLRSGAAGAQGRGAIAEIRLRAKKVGPLEIRATSLRPIGVGAAMPAAHVSSLKLNAQ